MGRPVAGLKKHISCLHTVVRPLGLVLHCDQLHPEAMPGAVVARHDEEYALRQLEMRACRNNSGGIAVAKSSFNGRDDALWLKPLPDVVLGQKLHGE